MRLQVVAGTNGPVRSFCQPTTTICEASNVVAILALISVASHWALRPPDTRTLRFEVLSKAERLHEGVDLTPGDLCHCAVVEEPWYARCL